MAENPVTCLLEGLFPNLFRYLSGRPKLVKKKSTQQDVDLPEHRAVAAADDNGTKVEQGSHVKGCSENLFPKTSPVEQSVAPSYISPHPSVNFAEVPTIYEVQSRLAIAKSLKGDKPSSQESHGSVTESASISGSSAQGRAAQLQAEAPAQTSRPESSSGFDLQSRKKLNRHSLPSLSLDRGRNFSNSSSSSNETLLGSSDGSSPKASPVASRPGQDLRHTAEKAMSEKKIRGLEAACEELKTEIADKTGRVEELEESLAISERDRERNFNTALQLYGNSGTLALVERRNLLDEIRQLSSDALTHEAQTWEREEYIENLHEEISRYSSEPKWDHMRRCFFGLQQQYGRMPQELKDLRGKYEDLEKKHVEVSDKLKWLEGSYTEVKAQCSQVQEERDRLELDARHFKQRAEEVDGRYKALKAKHDRMVEQKAKAEAKPQVAVEKAALAPLGLGVRDYGPSLRSTPMPAKKSKFMDLFPKAADAACEVSECSMALGAVGTEQVTPARTGGTSGISRDEWRRANQDLRGFTEVFRGPRGQPVDIVASGIATTGVVDGRPLTRSEDGASLSMEGDALPSTRTDKLPTIARTPPPGFEIDFNFTNTSGDNSFAASTTAPSNPPPTPSPSAPTPSPTNILHPNPADIPSHQNQQPTSEQAQHATLHPTETQSTQDQHEQATSEQAQHTEQRREQFSGVNRKERRKAERERKKVEKVEAEKARKAMAKKKKEEEVEEGKRKGLREIRKRVMGG